MLDAFEKPIEDRTEHVQLRRSHVPGGRDEYIIKIFNGNVCPMKNHGKK